MNTAEQDLLIGRLAVHYKVLSKEQVAAALKRYRRPGQTLDLPRFLITEGLVTEDVMRKLLAARQQYLRKQGVASVQPASLVQPATAPSTPGQPAAAPSTRPLSVAPPPPTAAPSPTTVPSSPAAPSPAAPSPPAPSPAAPSPAAPSPPAPSQDTAPAISARPLAGGKLNYRPGISLEELLVQLRQVGASDLHVHSGAPLKVRLHGELIDTSGELDRSEAERLIFGLLGDEQRRLLEEEQQVDFAYSIPGVGRFRSNAYYQQRGLDAVFRAVPPTPPTLEELGLPATLERLVDYHQGLVLLTGPAGCGKSSTMAALVNLINERQSDHVLTVEDPIEYVHGSKTALVNQREVGPHTGSFARALRAALREDPDVIAIGELRDLETIELALTAAETGHLVLGTLHTSSAIRTINRVLGVFPPNQQAQIRTMVSESLRAIVSQRLVPRADGEGRVPAVEILLANKAIGNLIRENKTFQIRSQMQTGAAKGMCLLDSSLAELVRDGVITRETALRFAEDGKRFAAA